MRRTLLTSCLALLLLLSVVLPASAERPPEYRIDEDRRAALLAAIAGPDVTTYDGEIAGALWVGQVPDDWNGDLVVWAHGYRGEGLDLYVDPPPARQWLLDEGYAWVASSYRRNSYDPGIGVLDTKNAARAFERILGKRDVERTYLAGASMGGHVTVASIERYANLYDGAMPACGVLGDVELFDYFLDYNVGAAAFAGLDRSGFAYPSDSWVADTVDPRVKPALSLFDEVGAPISAWAFDGELPGVPDLLVGAGEDFKDFVEVGSGGERVTYDVAWDYWHAAGAGDFFFDLGEGDGTIANRPGRVSQNTDMTYAEEYLGVDGGIDDIVARVEASNRVRRSKGLKPAVLVDGDPTVPVLSIHTIGDLFVPIEMEQIYAREVVANGKQDLLVQRSMRDVGHCTFTGSEWIQTYTDLFEWVETGVRPAGEDLLGDISDPDLGCRWTIDDGGGTAFRPLFPC